MKIKFIMAKGENITLSYEQAQKVLNSSIQIIKILDEEGNWTGITINKAHIICTKKDIEAERNENLIKKEFRLPEPELREQDGRIRVPGGLQFPHVRKNIKNIWNALKTKGCFPNSSSYEEWEKQKYLKKKDSKNYSNLKS